LPPHLALRIAVVATVPLLLLVVVVVAAHGPPPLAPSVLVCRIVHRALPVRRLPPPLVGVGVCVCVIVVVRLRIRIRIRVRLCIVVVVVRVGVPNVQELSCVLFSVPVGAVSGQAVVQRRFVPGAREGGIKAPESLNGGKGHDLCRVVGLEIVVVIVGREAPHSAAGGSGSGSHSSVVVVVVVVVVAGRCRRGTRGKVGTLCVCSDGGGGGIASIRIGIRIGIGIGTRRGSVHGGALGGRGTKELREVLNGKALVDAIGGRGSSHGGRRVRHRRVHRRGRSGIGLLLLVQVLLLGMQMGMLCVVVVVIALGCLWVVGVDVDVDVDVDGSMVVIRRNTGIQDPQVVQWIQGDPSGRVRTVYNTQQVPPRGRLEDSRL